MPATAKVATSRIELAQTIVMVDGFDIFSPYLFPVSFPVYPTLHRGWRHPVP
jgi:hypothetical protein